MIMKRATVSKRNRTKYSLRIKMHNFKKPFPFLFDFFALYNYSLLFFGLFYIITIKYNSILILQTEKKLKLCFRKGKYVTGQ